MKTCETCKWWGCCENGVFQDGQEKRRERYCGRIPRGYHIPCADLKENEAIVEDDEGWAIFTCPKFGCVLHEDKK